MTPRVTYQLEGSVATIALDDGKVNVMSLEMICEINQALDRASDDRAVVILRGRDGVFSAGFDLPVLRAGGDEAFRMLRAGFDLTERVLSFPLPVVIACTGHAVAMGVFLLLSGDYRVGATGPFKITANEVAIGLTMPRAAVEICRQRLAPAHFNRATILAEPYTPDTAVEAGFLDRVVDPSQLSSVVGEIAGQLTQLDLDAHRATKQRARGATLQAVHDAIEADAGDLSRARATTVA
ncbi:MAG TPA: crotonase/enoyl-CoA hydratase family protein [Acidimicrobiales bacterium]